VGVLFLTVNITFIIGVSLLEPLIATPVDFLNISENETMLLLGVLFELVNGIAYVSIAILMFPKLKRRNESLALGYIGIRMIEFVMQIIVDLSPLALLTISQEFVQASAPVASSYQVLASMLLGVRYWGFQMISLTFGLSALFFYSALYQSKLIPRWISIWGLIAVVLVLTNLMLVLFAITEDFGIITGLPMLLNELFLGVWLIIKGFNSTENA
jgi:hypothetical protein